MNKCVGAIEEFEFLPLSTGKHLHLTIAVTGWLCSGKYSMYDFSPQMQATYLSSRCIRGQIGGLVCVLVVTFSDAETAARL